MLALNLRYLVFSENNLIFMKKFICLILLALACMSCANENGNDKVELSTLRISILPDESQEKLLQRYTPLFEYLSREIGIPYQLIIPKDYDELLVLFHDKKIDLAYFGGFTFMKAYQADHAEPLVMRDVDTKFTSYFLVRSDDPRHVIKDFAGRPFAFGSKLSTSGHLMPRYYLKEMGIMPESFFSEVLYSGKHDLTANWVRDGKIDLGVANHAVIDLMYRDGRLSPKDVRILSETPPYPDYVWALRPLGNTTFSIKLRDAFMSLSKLDPEQAKILDGVDAGSFLPAGINDFSKLGNVMAELNMSGRK